MRRVGPNSTKSLPEKSANVVSRNRPTRSEVDIRERRAYVGAQIYYLNREFRPESQSPREVYPDEFCKTHIESNRPFQCSEGDSSVVSEYLGVSSLCTPILTGQSRPYHRNDY